MKICSHCEITKEDTEFNKKRKGLQPFCKLCQRERSRQQYEENKEHQKKNIYAARKVRRKLLHEHLLELFKFGCLDCGITDPEVLEWDHRENKKYDISKMIVDGFSIERVDKELENCDLVCANCHRKRTYKRNKCYKNN